MTGKATNYKNKQGDNPICLTRDEISQPSRPISPRAATAVEDGESIIEMKNFQSKTEIILEVTNLDELWIKMVE